MNRDNGAPNGRFDALDRSHSGTEFNIINILEGPTLRASFKTLPATLPERVKAEIWVRAGPFGHNPDC